MKQSAEIASVTMSKFFEHSRDELRRLPSTLTKLIGGILAAVGAGRFAYGANHSAPSVLDLLIAVLGFAVFILATRSGERRTREAQQSKQSADQPIDTIQP